MSDRKTPLHRLIDRDVRAALAAGETVEVDGVGFKRVVHVETGDIFTTVSHALVEVRA